MEHPAELKVYSFLDKARQGKAKLSDETVTTIVKHVEAAVKRQFQSDEARTFRLRASNIGKATCQLWFAKNKPETAVPPSSHFLLRMLIGDITEAVFKGLLREAGVDFEEPERVETDIGGQKISGEYDLILDGKVDDIKSASPWSYRNKWLDGKHIEENDSFGYVGQLTTYAKAKNVEPGGWWVINHSSGEFKYVPYQSDPVEVTQKLNDTVHKLDKNEFARCFKPVKETFRGTPTGNHVLGTECKFCDYKYACWGDSLSEESSRVSKAKDKPTVFYVDTEHVT
tara:strand:- start:867 stop:1718 length:852 start_codon:yes stop_codon:yes gene_type:complete